MAYANKTDLQDLATGIRDRLLIKDKTEALALAQSKNYPNCIYYTSDTHCIVVAGNIYGRGDSADMSFFSFVENTSGQNNWDPHRVYLVPANGGLAVWVYTNIWESHYVVNFNPATAASEISYDPTSSGIEATDVQTAIDKVEKEIGEQVMGLAREAFPQEAFTSGYVGFNQQTMYLGTGYADAYAGLTVSTADSSSYRVMWGSRPVPQGTLVVATAEYSVSQLMRVAVASASPVRYYADNGTMKGFQCDRWVYHKTQPSHRAEFLMPCDGYLLFSYYTAASNLVTPFSAVCYDTGAARLLTDTVRKALPAAEAPSIYGQGSQAQTQISTDCSTIEANSNSYTLWWTRKPVPRGTVLEISGSHGSAIAVRLCVAEASPQEYYDANGTMIGFKADWPVYRLSSLSHSFSFVMPQDGYLLWSRYVYMSQFSLLFRDPSNTLLASRMASEAGLGYDLHEHVAHIVQAGFAYGCKIYRDNLFKLSGDCTGKFQNDKSLVYLPKFDMSQATNCASLLSGCTALLAVPPLSMAEGAVCDSMFYNCSGTPRQLVIDLGPNELGSVSNLFASATRVIRIERLHTKSITNVYRLFYNNAYLTHISGFDLDSAVTNINTMFYANTALRHCVMHGLGKSAATAYNFSALTAWGVASDAEPDARQSLIDSLINYSYNRKEAEMPTCTITLSTNTKNLLTDEEIQQITDKGFTIA